MNEIFLWLIFTPLIAVIWVTAIGLIYLIIRECL